MNFLQQSVGSKKMSEKESNENIKQRMNQVELILSSLDTGLSVINSDYTISWVNEKIHKILGKAILKEYKIEVDDMVS